MSLQFSPVFLDQLRGRISLAGLIARKTRLVRAGKLLKGVCPFHSEKTPSFVVYEDQGHYHCFGCGAHGDAVTFLMHTEGYSFPEAVKYLAQQSGMPLPIPEKSEHFTAHELPLQECLEAAARWFEDQLYSVAGHHARQYLARRKLNQETIHQFRLGYAPNGNGLKTYLMKAGFSHDTLVAAGLVISSEEQKKTYDRFRDRLIFPICNRRGQVIGFGGRVLGNGEPKYLNSPETVLFHKGKELYGLHHVRKTDSDQFPLIVCEGYTDVLALYQAGYQGAVATLGTAVTDYQIELLWRLNPQPLLCFDGDQAGQQAAFRAAERALSLLRPGFSLNFIALPIGEDPASLLEKDQLNDLAKIVERKQSLAELLWHKEIAGQTFQTPEQKALLHARLLQYVGQIKDHHLQIFYKDYFKNKIFEYFRMNRRRNGIPSSMIWSRPRLNPQEHQQGILLLIIVNHPEILGEVFEAFSLLDLKEPTFLELRETIIEQFHLCPGLDSAQLRHHLCSRGYENVLHKLNALAVLHAPFAAPSADLKEALNGWWSTWRLYQQHQNQMDESRYFSAALSQEMSREMWQKIQKMKEARLAEQKQNIYEIYEPEC